MSQAVSHIPGPMTYRGHIRALLALGLPIVGGHLGQVAIGITDTVMLGRYSVEALAAITLGAAYLHLFLLVGSGFAWAVMPMVASFHAEGDATSLRRATRMGLWLSTAFALLVLPCMLFAERIFLSLDQPPEVAADAASYLIIAGWGLLPALGMMVLKSYLAALEHTRPVLWIILATAVLNGLLNWALIFGNWGAPELGLRGAAIASLFTQSAGLLGLALYAVRALPENDIFRRLWRVDAAMMARVFSLGWPIGLTTLAEAGLFYGASAMMGWLGAIPLAAHGIVLQLSAITFLVHMGLSNAATVRAGNAKARRDRLHLVRGALTATLLSLVFAAATVVVFVMMPAPLVRLFLDVSDPAAVDVLEIAIALMVMAALFQVMDGAQVIALGLLRGLQDTRVPMMMAAISYWGIGMPSSYVFGFVLGWGGVGVWFGLVVGLAAAAASLIARFWGPVLRRFSLSVATARATAESA